MYNIVLFFYIRVFFINRYNNGGVFYVVIGMNGILWNKNEVIRLLLLGFGVYYGR